MKSKVVFRSLSRGNIRHLAAGALQMSADFRQLEF
jgi:hypothetical protein